jgi:predicted dehydrogenase
MWTSSVVNCSVVDSPKSCADPLNPPIVTVTADLGKWFPADPSSRLFAPELGGGALLDLGVYPVSFVSMVLGTPDRIVTLVDPAFTGVDG